MSVKSFGLVAGLISLLFLLLYIGVEALKIPLLTDPAPMLNTPGVSAAIAGVVLLTADVFLPVPSSIIMVTNGVLFGLLAGALLSLAGRIGSFMLGYFLGTSAFRLTKQLLPESQISRSNVLLKKWGVLAIVVTRPVPILSETMAIMAGVSSVPLKKSLVAAIFGSLPEAILFAATGAVAGSFHNTALMFLTVLLVTGIFWLISQRISWLTALD